MIMYVKKWRGCNCVTVGRVGHQYERTIYIDFGLWHCERNREKDVFYLNIRYLYIFVNDSDNKFYLSDLNVFSHIIYGKLPGASLSILQQKPGERKR